MNDRKNKFLKDTMIFLSGSFGSKFLSMIMLPIYTSILTTSEYGELDIILTTIGLLMPIVTWGLVDAIFRYVMSKDFHNPNVITSGTIICGISFFILSIILIILNVYLKWKYLYLMLLLLYTNMCYDIFTNYLKAKQLSQRYVAAGLLQTFINLSLNIMFLVNLRLGVKGYILAFTISYAAVSAMIFLKEKMYLEIRIRYFDTYLAGKMLRYSFPLIFSTLSWWIVTSSDKYMIKYMLGSDEVGIYSIASKVPLLLQTIISILQTVWQISTNEIYEEEPEKLRENFEIFTKYFREVGFISGSMLIILIQPIMRIIAQKEFYSGWIYAPFLILSIIFSFATGMVATLYGAYQDNKGVLYSVLLGGIINIILNFFLIKGYGVFGATISTAISRLIIALYRLKDTEKFLEFDRGYKFITINCILITLQCCALIYMKSYTYLVQILFLTILLILNKHIIFEMKNYMKSVILQKVKK